MEATCVTHVGVCVRDMAESLKFYRDALGMKVIGEKVTDITCLLYTSPSPRD